MGQLLRAMTLAETGGKRELITGRASARALGRGNGQLLRSMTLAREWGNYYGRASARETANYYGRASGNNFGKGKRVML